MCTRRPADRRVDRAAWLREIHPDGNVVLVCDDIPDDQGAQTSRAWAERTVEALGRAPDIVFTSEEYGARYARLLGARHESVDPARTRFAISGTSVRGNPSAHWDQLEPCVRAWYVRRVCVLGAESTGTTTLVKGLAEHYDTDWVAEYGRTFCEARLDAGPIDWRSEDFVHIATTQQAAEDDAARTCGPTLICDTDALATSIWHQRYLGRRSAEVDALAAERRYALYILTSDDIGFVQEETRDGEHLCSWMTERFREELDQRPEPWIEVRGAHDQRVLDAVTAINSVATTGSHQTKRSAT